MDIDRFTVEFIIDKTLPNVLIPGVELNKRYLGPSEVGIQLDNPNDTFKEITMNDEVYAGELT